jgi:hypothetical protein
LIEIGLLVLEEILKNFQCIFTLSLLSPLGKGVSLHLNNLESPPPEDDLCQVWSKLASGSGEEVNNVKVYRQMDEQTDNEQQAIRKAHLSFQLR